MSYKGLIVGLLLIFTVFVIGASEGQDYLSQIEIYHIGDLSASPYDCSVDVKVSQTSFGTSGYVVITKPSGSVADDQVAEIPLLQFYYLLESIPELSKRPLPIADHFQRDFSYGTFIFSFGPFGRSNVLQYAMTVDSRQKNSTVLFANETHFLDVFRAAIDKFKELANSIKSK